MELPISLLFLKKPEADVELTLHFDVYSTEKGE